MIYKFRNIDTNEIVEVEMPMKDYQPYKGENGKEDFWERIYDLPQVNIGNAKTVDPFDNNRFVTKTRDMKGTYGDFLIIRMNYQKEELLLTEEKIQSKENILTITKKEQEKNI